MKPKARLKAGIDILMTFLLLFLMGYQFWGEAPHEWVKGLFKGKYSALRILKMCIDCLVLIAMFAQMYKRYCDITLCVPFSAV